MRTIIPLSIALFLVAPSNAAESAPAGHSRYKLDLGSGSERFVLASREREPAIPATDMQNAVARLPFAIEVRAAAQQVALDPALVHAVIHVESRHNPAARSPKGALGLMQVMPETAKRYGIADSTRSVEANLSAGTRYLRDLMSMFGGRLDLVLAAYNAGENAVVRHGERIPPYRETQRYVPAVLEKYREWQEPPPSTEPQPPQRVVYMPGTVLLDPASRRRGLP